MSFLSRLGSAFVRKPPPVAQVDDWLKASRWIMEDEGGYSDRESDKGGPTNMGITLPTLSHWRGRQATVLDLKKLTEAEALAIYHTNYWQAMRCQELPHGVDFVVMDAGVMSGQSRAIKFLQQAVVVEQDGLLGPVTMAAVHAGNPAYIVGRISTFRGNFYRSLNEPDNQTGWLSRVDRTRVQANSLIA